MNELVFIKKNEAVCDSLLVADKFHKRHDNILRTIESLLKNEETHKMFNLGNYIEQQNNQTYRKYIMNRDGFSLLVMGFTGKDALVWKLKYIEAFNAMEVMLMQHHSPVWSDTRALTKDIRKKETDSINLFIEYAIANGSQNAKRYYSSLSILADKVAGIETKRRDLADIQHLTRLYLIEDLIENCIKDGIGQQLYYKDIYKACKTRVDQFMDITYLTSNKAIN